MRQINHAAAQNGAAAEALAATADEMAAQAEAMHTLVQFFRENGAEQHDSPALVTGDA